MSNNKKDAPADAKRPHATLDLKATDVTPAEAAAEKAASASASSSASASDKPVESAVSSAAAGDAKSAAGDAKLAAGAAPGDPKKPEPPKPAAKPTPPPPPPRSGGRLFSHLLAGMAGGALAIGLVEWAAPRLGIATPSQQLQVRTTELQERLSRLESNAAKSGELAGQVKSAEDRVAALEGRTDTLSASQTQLTSDTKSAIDKLSSETISADAQRRLNAVDERLATIAKAAEEKGGGNVAQVTAMTGKLADVQAALTEQIEALRKTVPQNVEPRLAQLGEQAEGAKANTQRIDNDLNNLRTDAARLGQRLETLKADSDRAGATLIVLQEEAARLTSGFAEVKATVASQVKGGVGEALNPVTAKLSELEKGLDGVVKSEEDRRLNAERIVVSLELANLKRQVDAGQPYATGLAEVRKAAGNKLDLSALEHFKESGVPTIAELQRSFRPVANAVVDAAVTPAEGGVIDRLVAGAKSVVRVRNMNPSPTDKSADAVVARMQTALAEGDLGEVLANAAELPAGATGPAQDWLSNVKARHAVDAAIGQVEKQLKTSLTSAPPVQPDAGSGGAEPPVRLPAPGSVR